MELGENGMEERIVAEVEPRGVFVTAWDLGEDEYPNDRVLLSPDNCRALVAFLRERGIVE
jgi:hypothetical protein